MLFSGRPFGTHERWTDETGFLLHGISIKHLALLALSISIEQKQKKAISISTSTSLLSLSSSS